MATSSSGESLPHGQVPPAPPGMERPVPSTPPHDVNVPMGGGLAGLLQIMQLQIQQLQMQFNDMLRNHTSSSGGQLMGSSGGGSNSTARRNERHFRRRVTFTNKNESWEEWRTRFVTSVRESSPILATVLEQAEITEDKVLKEHVIAADPNFKEAADLSHVLHARLVAPTTGVSFAITES